MVRIGLKSLLAHKLRTALTGFAVVIGVAFVAGTFVFTDTIDESFKNLFERAQKGVDVSVQATEAVEVEFEEPPTMPAEVLERVQSVPGVEEAAGTVSAEGTLLDREGEPILSQGPPTIIESVPPERFGDIVYREGDRPDEPDEVALDRATAEEYDFGVGDTVTVSGRAPKKDYEVSGIITLGDSDSLGGLRYVGMTLPEAQRVTGHDGYDQVVVAAEGGTSPEELKAAIQRELGDEYTVLTGEEQAEQQAQDLSDALGFIRIALLVFAGVALLVGGFLIFNTFAVTVAQRTREFALLRTLGASRRQVLASVVAETAVVGLVASLLGIAGGLLLAPALRALLSSFGLDLGTTGTVLAPRTVIVGLLVGIIATVVSGFVPARRATRVEPISALREAAAPTVGRLRRRRLVVAILVEVLGLAVLLTALLGDTGSVTATASLIGAGAVVMIFGVALIAPVLVRPLSSAIGRPLERIQGLTGRLARENATRQPQRTAVTASALMVGLALVVFVTIFAAGLRTTIDKALDEQLQAAGIVSHEDGFSPLPAGVAERLAAVDGVRAVSPIRFETGRLREKGSSNQTVQGIDPTTIGEVIRPEWSDGAVEQLARLGDDEALVPENLAEGEGIEVGDTLHFTSPENTQPTYRVVGTYDGNVGMIGGVVVTNASLERDWRAEDIAFALFAGEPGAEEAQLEQAAASALDDYPTADVMTIEAFKDEQAEEVNTLLGLVFALLSLSVIVALLGIINTLALSVFERTRELGMLRAVGMSRRQMRRMIRAESMITAAIGALLGVALGIVFAALVSVPLAEEGFSFSLPVGTLIGVVVAAAVAGVLAAVPPARRAARVDVLRAVTTE